MTTPTATSRALAITEILEHILIQLPPKDILLAQSVSKSVNSLVATSPALQAALGFRTSSGGATGTTTTCSEETEVACTINPIISSAFPFLFSPDRCIPEDDIEDWKQRFGIQEPPPEDAEKAVCLVKQEWKDNEGKLTFAWYVDDRPVGADKFPPPDPSQCKFWYSQWLFNAAAWRREEASWRRMQVTREPLRRLVLLDSCGGQIGTEASECILLLGEHGEESETNNNFFEARKKLKVEVTRENIRYRRDKSKPEEIPRRGWLKINGQSIDLTRWESLPMSFVYDYLSGQVCDNEGPPQFQVSFHSSYPPRPDPILEDRWDMESGNVSEGMVERDGVGDGATMLIRTRSFHGCEPPSGPIYGQLTSLAAGNIEMGPWVSVFTCIFE